MQDFKISIMDFAKKTRDTLKTVAALKDFT